MNNQDIKAIISLIHISFEWKTTPQGVKYWSEVCDNLEELIKNAEKKTCEKCGREL